MTTDDNAPVIGIFRTIPGELVVQGARVETLGAGLPTREQQLEFSRGKTVLVSCFSDRVDGELLDAAGPQLKGVCNFAVGYDNIDVAACRERGIPVSNTPDAVTEGTADAAWLLIMATARKLIAADRYARSGQWADDGPIGMAEWLGMDLTGRTLLIVGAGRIGYATALRSQGWGMRVQYVARSPHIEFEMSPLAAQRVTLEEGLRQADVVSIHTPLTDETRHLIGAREIGLMKPTAILVNTARGPVVDESALAAALKEGTIWGAGLDVFEHEPRVHPDLVGLDNITMMPHIGSAEKRWREEMTRMVGRNAERMLRGERPVNPVG
ncbi:MAG: D-glycerate dehydrogenase [Planctomycetota bacterium]